MSELPEELLNLSERLEKIADRYSKHEITDPIDRLQKAAETVGKAWSGSWLGYQAYVYYRDLQPPPPGAHFSQEWGFVQLRTIRTTTGDWVEYTAEGIEKAIYKIADDPDLTLPRQACEEANRTFDECKSEVQSILTTAVSQNEDPFIVKLREEAEKIPILSKSLVLRGIRPSGETMSRDTLALTQGLYTPPHLTVLSETIALKQPENACLKLAKVAKKAGSHLARTAQKKTKLSWLERWKHLSSKVKIVAVSITTVVALLATFLAGLEKIGDFITKDDPAPSVPAITVRLLNSSDENVIVTQRGDFTIWLPGSDGYHAKGKYEFRGPDGVSSQTGSFIVQPNDTVTLLAQVMNEDLYAKILSQADCDFSLFVARASGGIASTNFIPFTNEAIEKYYIQADVGKP
jgi:hypothetical protein